MPRFVTTLLQTGGNNVGIEVPAEILDELGGGKRPPVVVTLKGYTYRTTVGVMKGKSLIPVTAATRAESGAVGGEETEVTVELDTAPRIVDVPADLASALDATGVRAAFDALAPSRRKEHVRAVEDAKAADTRARRITKIVDGLVG